MVGQSAGLGFHHQFVLGLVEGKQGHVMVAKTLLHQMHCSFQHFVQFQHHRNLPANLVKNDQLRRALFQFCPGFLFLNRATDGH